MNEKSERRSVEEEEEVHMFSDLLLGAGCTSNAGQLLVYLLSRRLVGVEG
jgi:hypothetical protein